MGSVKDLVVLKQPEGKIPGIGRFIFSDRYSVFDWGEMPDHIEYKGKSICISTAHFF
jgi:phosphoribosylaminoimidazole-succinocarboxamide synthase